MTACHPQDSLLMSFASWTPFALSSCTSFPIHGSEVDSRVASWVVVRFPPAASLTKVQRDQGPLQFQQDPVVAVNLETQLLMVPTARPRGILDEDRGVGDLRDGLPRLRQ